MIPLSFLFNQTVLDEVRNILEPEYETKDLRCKPIPFSTFDSWLVPGSPGRSQGHLDRVGLTLQTSFWSEYVPIIE